MPIPRRFPFDSTNAVYPRDAASNWYQKIILTPDEE